MSGLTPFQREVYALARAIPPGETRTYGELAEALGDAGLARAVGQAMGHNPFCAHRALPPRPLLRAGALAAGRQRCGELLRMLQIERARIGNEPGLFDEEPWCP